MLGVKANEPFVIRLAFPNTVIKKNAFPQWSLLNLLFKSSNEIVMLGNYLVGTVQQVLELNSDVISK